VSGIEEDIALMTSGNDAGNPEDGGAAFSNPSVSEVFWDGEILKVPAGQILGAKCLDRDLVGNSDRDRAMILWDRRQIGVDQNLQQGSGIGFRCVDDGLADGIPTAAVEHGSAGAEDSVARIGDSKREH
jgi:hypothetical protein